MQREQGRGRSRDKPEGQETEASRAASKAESTAPVKRERASGSALKAWMVRVAPIVSPASVMASASVSCAMRERRRTLRPKPTIGKTMTGMAATTSSESFGEVTNIMPMAPMQRITLRSATEAVAPTVDLICVVSAVSRETISPERFAS